MDFRYYILNRANKKAAFGVIDETATHIVVQKLKISINPLHCPHHIVNQDNSFDPVTKSKGDLSSILDNAIVTKDYWEVWEFLTGWQRKTKRPLNRVWL